MQLLYMGFEQAKNIRQYTFHKIARGEETKVLVVSTDLALLQKTRVGLQEGPALCLHMLAAEMEAAQCPQQLPFRRELTDGHIQAYLVSRAALASKKSSPTARSLAPRQPPS